jgi:hypothetical protein
MLIEITAYEVEQLAQFLARVHTLLAERHPDAALHAKECRDKLEHLLKQAEAEEDD